MNDLVDRLISMNTSPDFSNVFVCSYNILERDSKYEQYLNVLRVFTIKLER